MPKISVIIPVYNAEKYLNKCLDSVLNQTFSDFEVCLINDGSTDRSLDICKSYAVKDNRINVYNQPNSGVGKARNVGVWNCVGEYITFVDSDDWIDKDMFQILVDIAEKFNTDIIRCNAVRHQINKEEIWWTPPLCNKILSSRDIQTKVIPLLISPQKEQHWNHRLLRSCYGHFFKRNVITRNDISFSDYLRSGEDLLFTVQAMLCSESMYIVENPFYHYMCCNGNSLSKNAFEKRMENRKILRNTLVDLLKNSEGYEEDIHRWEQEDRRAVYLDIRIAAVYQQNVTLKQRLSKIDEITKSDYCRKAFKNKINKKLPLKMYFLYCMIKYRMNFLLLCAVKFELRKSVN